MDSQEWSKTFDVLSISRIYLESIGFTHQQVQALTDEDMQTIADILIADYLDHEFDEDVKFVTRLRLVEKAGKNAKGNESLREKGNTTDSI